MSRNGSGVWNRLFSWTQDRINSINILATRMDGEMDDMATGLTNSIAKDGQTTPTANLPMGGFKHTGVGVGTSSSDYARLDQVQSDVSSWGGVSGGTANALTVTLFPAITAYADGMKARFKASLANTAAATVSVNGLAAKTLLDAGGNAMTANRIILGGVYEVTYVLATDSFYLIGGPEVTLTATQTITNKTLTSPTINTPSISTPTFTTTVTIPNLVVAPVASGTTIIEIGYQGGTANVSGLDFHSGATATDYDVRVQASGGTGVAGNGTLDLTSGSLFHNGRTFLNVLTSGSISTIGNTTVTIPTGAWKALTLRVLGLKAATAYALYLRVNGDTGANYGYSQIAFNNTGSISLGRLTESAGSLLQRDTLVDTSAVTENPVNLTLILSDPTGGGHKGIAYQGANRFTTADFGSSRGDILWRSTAPITSLQILLRDATGTSPAGALVSASAGTYYIVGEL